jgi:hypothetical protein
MKAKFRAAVSEIISAGILALLPCTAGAAEDSQLLQKCLSLPDSTPRVDCYDKIVWPKVSGGRVSIRSVSDCRLLVDDDHRRRCYNGFLQGRVARETNVTRGLRPPADIPSALLRETHR